MPILNEVGDGVRTVYPLPVHTKAATATVNGGAATLASQADASVTFSVAPVAGGAVAITYTAVALASSSSSSAAAGAVDSVSAGVARLFTSFARTSPGTSVGVLALRLYHVPFYVPNTITISSLGINVTVAGAASTVARAGIYAQATSGYIGSLIVQTTDLDTASIGYKSATVADTILTPGWYYMDVVCSGTPTLTAYNSGLANILGFSPLGFSGTIPIDYRYETLASAVLPATPNAATTASLVGVAHTPAVFVGAK